MAHFKKEICTRILIVWVLIYERYLFDLDVERFSWDGNVHIVLAKFRFLELLILETQLYDFLRVFGVFKDGKVGISYALCEFDNKITLFRKQGLVNLIILYGAAMLERADVGVFRDHLNDRCSTHCDVDFA